MALKRSVGIAAALNQGGGSPTQADAANFDWWSVQPGQIGAHNVAYFKAATRTDGSAPIRVVQYITGVHFAAPMDHLSTASKPDPYLPASLPEEWYAHSVAPSASTWGQTTRIRSGSGNFLMEPYSSSVVRYNGQTYHGWIDYRRVRSQAILADGNGWDGLFVDVLGLYGVAGAVDPTTGKGYTDARWLAGTSAVGAAMYTAMGGNEFGGGPILIENSLNSAPVFLGRGSGASLTKPPFGAMAESWLPSYPSFPGNTGNDSYLKNIQMIQTVQNSSGAFVFLSCDLVLLLKLSASLADSSPLLDQWQRVGCALVMLAQANAPGPTVPSVYLGIQRGAQVYDTFRYPLAPLLAMGEPAADADTSGTLFSRVYQGGVVALNTTGTPATYKLPGPATTVYREAAAPTIAKHGGDLVAVAPNSAVFYLATVTAPTVTAISPTVGAAAGATTVTVTGTNFVTGTGATTVAFGANPATAVTVSSSTSLTCHSPAGADTVDVVVSTAFGVSPSVAADRYTYAPTVTAVSPSSGDHAGGGTVTVTGTGFANATAVNFGGTAATFTSVVISADGHSLTCTAPAGTASATPVDVTVVTPSGTSPTTAADHYTYTATVAAPTVAAIGPASGPQAGGTTVTVTGTGFKDSNGSTVVSAVVFGHLPAASFAVVSSTQLTCVSPAAVPGTVDLLVTTPGGTSARVAADHYTTLAPVGAPTVTAISPTFGPAAGGTTVTVTGTNFTGFTGPVTVAFGAVPATAVNVLSATSLTCVAPADPGPVDVTVTTPNGTSPTSAADVYTYGPKVTGVSPSSGDISGGATVTVTGAGFAGATAVTFGATAATLGAVTANQITVTAPAGAAGIVDVTVVTPAGTSPAALADQYTYTTVVPTLVSAIPSAGPQAGGTPVTLTGTNFEVGGVSVVTGVTFGANPATSVVVVSATSLTCVAPAGSALASVAVTVATSNGSTGTVAYTYTATPAPVVTSISPTSGPSAGSTAVTVTGTHLTGATGVKFGTVSATSVVVVDDTTVTCVSPASGTLAAGAANTPVEVTVTTPAGTSHAGALKPALVGPAAMSGVPESGYGSLVQNRILTVFWGDVTGNGGGLEDVQGTINLNTKTILYATGANEIKYGIPTGPTLAAALAAARAAGQRVALRVLCGWFAPAWFKALPYFSRFGGIFLVPGPISLGDTDATLIPGTAVTLAQMHSCGPFWNAAAIGTWQATNGLLAVLFDTDPIVAEVTNGFPNPQSTDEPYVRNINPGSTAFYAATLANLFTAGLDATVDGAGIQASIDAMMAAWKYTRVTHAMAPFDGITAAYTQVGGDLSISGTTLTSAGSNLVSGMTGSVLVTNGGTARVPAGTLVTYTNSSTAALTVTNGGTITSGTVTAGYFVTDVTDNAIAVTHATYAAGDTRTPSVGRYGTQFVGHQNAYNDPPSTQAGKVAVYQYLTANPPAAVQTVTANPLTQERNDISFPTAVDGGTLVLGYNADAAHATVAWNADGPTTLQTALNAIPKVAADGSTTVVNSAGALRWKVTFGTGVAGRMLTVVTNSLTASAWAAMNAPVITGGGSPNTTATLTAPGGYASFTTAINGNSLVLAGGTGAVPAGTTAVRATNTTLTLTPPTGGTITAGTPTTATWVWPITIAEFSVPGRLSRIMQAAAGGGETTVLTTTVTYSGLTTTSTATVTDTNAYSFGEVELHPHYSGPRALKRLLIGQYIPGLITSTQALDWDVITDNYPGYTYGDGGASDVWAIKAAAAGNGLVMFAYMNGTHHTGADSALPFWKAAATQAAADPNSSSAATFPESAYLHDGAGSRIHSATSSPDHTTWNYTMNPADPTWQAFKVAQAQYILGLSVVAGAPAWDGVFVDTLGLFGNLASVVNEAGTTTSPVDPIRGGTYTQANWYADTAVLAGKIYQAVQPGAFGSGLTGAPPAYTPTVAGLMMGNGLGGQFQYNDSAGASTGLWAQPGYWLMAETMDNNALGAFSTPTKVNANINMIVDSCQTRGRVLCASYKYAIGATPAATDQYNRIAVAEMLLGHNGYASSMLAFEAGANSDPGPYLNMAATLGAPTAGFTKTTVATGFLWTRPFANGFVAFYCDTSGTTTFTLPAPTDPAAIWWELDGTSKVAGTVTVTANQPLIYTALTAQPAVTPKQLAAYTAAQPAAWTPVNDLYTYTSLALNTITVPPPPGLQVGDFALLFVGWGDTSHNVTAWPTSAIPATKVTSANHRQQFFAGAATTSDLAGWQFFTGTATEIDGVVVAYRGVNPADPWRVAPTVSGQTNASSTVIDAGTGPSVVDGDRLVWFGCTTATGGAVPPTITPPQGFTAQSTTVVTSNAAGTNIRLLVADMAATATGPVGDMSGTASSACINGAMVVALKPGVA